MASKIFGHSGKLTDHGYYWLVTRFHLGWFFNGQTTLVINFGPWAVTTQVVLWVVGVDGKSMFDGTFDLKSPPG